MPETKEFRRINQALGKQPKIGPFPAGQVFPLAFTLFLSWSAKELLHLSWLQAALLGAWMMGTIWILTGTRSWRFFSKFVTTPHLIRAAVRYESLLVRQEDRGIRGQGDKGTKEQRALVKQRRSRR